MTSRVFRLHSTLELPLDDVHRFFDEEVELPVEIEDVEITRRNNTLIIKAVSAEDNISKYTPTAQLKASVTENRVYENEDGEWVEEPPEETEPSFGGGDDGEGPSWGSLAAAEEEEPEINSKLREYACFKGDRETVLQNTALQYPMFEVLCDLARFAGRGELTAIAAVDDELEAHRIVEGEDRAATIEIVEDPRERDADHAVQWRDNKFIN
ncbi:DUF7110 family protein [Halosegnis marinus]|uniref:Amphi-Trp domain-containing protein n=1 Tax=Halosegnis marinus TaxID=3034023 RepID=A0ABD5ZQM3_9EURY|nr:hypothetical protein [Halosegnis sp. DT85]